MRWIALPLALAVLAGAGCGDGSAEDEPTTLTVSAASSLKLAFEEYARVLASIRVRFSFAGSDELAAQIRQGARPDVFAAANTSLPRQLFERGLGERPLTFAGNRLVLAVPRDSNVRLLRDLERPGTGIAVGSPGVPVGAYTREVLARLGAAQSGRILANVRSNEPDVAGVVGKLSQGAADAGFVYATDVEATRGELRAIELPDKLQPTVAYAAVVLKGAGHRADARAFIDGLLRGRGLRVMHDAGFQPPP